MKFSWLYFAPLPFLYFINPDFDKAFGERLHRWIVSHSLIFSALLAWIISLMAKVILLEAYGIDIVITEMFIIFFKYFSVPIMIHLFLDINILKGDGGFYTISILPGKRLSGNESTLWLITNIIIGMIIVVYL
jgi:hypothetical protein